MKGHSCLYSPRDAYGMYVDAPEGDGERPGSTTVRFYRDTHWLGVVASPIRPY